MLDPTGGTPSVGQALFAVSNGTGGSPGAGEDGEGDDGGWKEERSGGVARLPHLPNMVSASEPGRALSASAQKRGN